MNRTAGAIWLVEVTADAMRVLAFMVAVVFVLCYHRLANWRATVMGRHVFAFMMMVACLLGLGVLLDTAGSNELAEQVARLFSFTVITIMLLWRLILLLRLQNGHGAARQKGRVTMFNKRPVAWLGLLASVLVAANTYLGTTDLVSDQVAGWIGLASVLLSAMASSMAYNAVTPLVDPKNANGVPLVPRSVGSRTP